MDAWERAIEQFNPVPMRLVWKNARTGDTAVMPIRARCVEPGVYTDAEFPPTWVWEALRPRHWQPNDPQHILGIEQDGFIEERNGSVTFVHTWGISPRD